MNKQEAKRFLRVINKNIDKIEEEAIQVYKENYLIESTDIVRISIDLKGNIKSTISNLQGYSDDVFNEREIIVYEFYQYETNLQVLFGELCFLNDYEDFVKWCEIECESLNWHSYKNFNKENFEEIAERNIEDSLSSFLEELNESIENRKQNLQKIVEN